MMIKKILNIVNSWIIISLLLYLFVCSILFCYGFINNDFISNGLILIGIISVGLYLFYRIVNNSTKIWDLLVIIMIFLGYLSYYNAYDKNVALRGFLNSREGLFVIISYYIIFLLGTTFRNNERIKKIVINLLTIFGMLSVIYGFVQLIDLDYFWKIPVVGKMIYSSSFFSNSNYYGTFMSIMSGIWCAKYFIVDSNKNNYYSLVVLGIFIFGIVCSGAMSSFVAFVLILIIIVLFILKQNINKKLICLKCLFIFIIFGFSFGMTRLIGGSNAFSDVLDTKNQVINVITGNVDDSFGTGRIYIWKETFKYLPDYILTGIGIDNFVYLGKNDGKYVYDSKEENNVIYKAHNEYLQVLATQGIFMFIIYVIFLLLILICTYKKIFIKDYSCLFFAVLSYIIQAIFNISMTRIAPIFFLLCGLLVSSNGEKSKLF